MVGVSRRAFLGYSAAIPLVLEELAYAQSKEDKFWTDAKKNDKLKQQALDGVLDAEARKYVSHFYAVEVEEKKAGKTEDKFALSFGTKKLKFFDSKLETSCRDELKKFAEMYCALGKLPPDKVQEEIERAYRTFAAELIDRVQNAEADVYRPHHLWGASIPSIGIVTKKFFDNPVYKLAEDRKSCLLDRLVFAKAADYLNNPLRDEVWVPKFGNSELRINTIWTWGVKAPASEFWSAVLENRWQHAQAQKILDKRRKVSEDYEKGFTEEWQNSRRFKYFVSMVTGSSKDSIANTSDPGTRKFLEGLMGLDWGFKCLPFDGKIVPYDPELVKKYQFDGK